LHGWPGWRRSTSPVGNDLVDLRHPLCRPEELHPRFDSRVFTASELALLATSPQVHRTRWLLWAAKESAFKASRKLDPQVRFLPRDFAVHLSHLGGERAEVSHRSGRFKVWLDQTDHWVHAVASQTAAKPGFRVDGDPSADPGRKEERVSERVRRLARTALGAVLNIAPSEVEIVSMDRIPEAHQRREPLPIDLSLSHDGRFVSCAWDLLTTR
jgi:phosphopantetheinyl transferase (holo-ACP synthase)